MKKTIEGKRYDTDTAECIAKVSKGNWNDFHHVSEQLYKTERGAWFIHGEGGPKTGYSESNGYSTSGGEAIFIVTEEEAFEWLQKHDKNDEIDEHFADWITEA